MSIAYLNGEIKPLSETRVSVMDRGFLFGDGIYEVIPVYSRRPFRIEEHLDRLAASMAGIRLDNPHSRSEWVSIITQVIAASASADQQVCIQVTRGEMAVRNHAFPATVTPTVLVFSEALTPPDATLRTQGVSAVSSADIRWLRCNIKATSLLANCLLRQIAVDAGCAETILFRDGLLTEGAAANIFVVRNGTLLAPPKNHLMLPGITYDVVLELAAQHQLPHRICEISEVEVRSADELLMTSSTREVLPIVQLDGKAIDKGQPGPITKQMIDWYQDYKRTVMHGEK